MGLPTGGFATTGSPGVLPPQRGGSPSKRGNPSKGGKGRKAPINRDPAVAKALAKLESLKLRLREAKKLGDKVPEELLKEREACLANVKAAKQLFRDRQ
jgi:hypothetical protein